MLTITFPLLMFVAGVLNFVLVILRERRSGARPLARFEARFAAAYLIAVGIATIAFAWSGPIGMALVALGLARLAHAAAVSRPSGKG